MLKILFTLIFLSLSLFSADKVSLQLVWLHQFQFAGFYMAKEKGFYAQNNLDVTILEADASDSVQSVLERKVDFAVGRPSLIIEKAKGRDIALLMAIFQHSPSVLIATNPDIKTVADLQDKKVMVTNEEVNAISLKAMLMIEGLKNKNIAIQKHSYKLQDLIDNNTDAMACYLSNEPYTLNKLGIKHTIFNPKDFGMDFYGDLLYTSQTLLKDNPKLVKRFYDATMQGWLYAFEHIQESAKIIHDKYNTKKKELDHLIYEGEVLKKLAFGKECAFGKIDPKRINEIINIYKIFNVIDKEANIDNFIDPLGFAKEQVYIGVLAKRGYEDTKNRWQDIVNSLNKNIETHHFNIVPLRFDEIEKAVKNNKIDFLLTNPMNYIQLSEKYNISRIASLKNFDKNHHEIKQFGGVIFTKMQNKQINTIEDVIDKRFGAVHRTSFGGWVVAQAELFENHIDEDDIKLSFHQTHDEVVYALLDGKIDVGTVRTDILESMAEQKLIDLKQIKIINQKKYNHFPYLISTELYPEWPLAKLESTDEELAFNVLSILVRITYEALKHHDKDMYGWGIPQDHSKVDILLKRLKIYPFDNQSITYKDVFEEYQTWIFILLIIFLLIIFTMIYINTLNVHLKSFNKSLEQKVKERTEELYKINKKLKFLANTDELTSINNRRHFFKKTTEYIKLAKRNNTPTTYLSLDIDHFKNINDTYGHQVGDEILKLFTQSVKHSLREIDLFGRVGGEEFAVCLQNTSIDGAKVIAEKIRQTVAKNYYEIDGKKIHVTVSIGMAQYNFQSTLNELIRDADTAMYQAKEKGRDQVVIFEQEN